MMRALFGAVHPFSIASQGRPPVRDGEPSLAPPPTLLPNPAEATRATPCLMSIMFPAFFSFT